MKEKELVSEFKEYIKQAFKNEQVLIQLLLKDNRDSADHDYLNYLYGEKSQLEICIHELDELIFKFWRDKGEIL